MTKVSMTVNGKSVSGEIEGRTLLVDFLREGQGLTGTHVGCDTSQCGACVVHVDGEAVKSCAIFAAEVDGANVTTIEGMANDDGSLSVIQQAFQDHHGLQCGFCTPGMVMSTASLLKDNPKPTEAEIRRYLEGNICRCTGYHNIVKAIMAASGQDVSSIAAE
ncbi:MAG: (2Fe-2S)-binding protein [Paracoccaceae bacterium]